MTPEEKADELVKKMYKVMSDSVSDITLYFSKQCVLVAVDEITRAIPDAGDDDSPYNHELIWWQEVRHEVEKL